MHAKYPVLFCNKSSWKIESTNVASYKKRDNVIFGVWSQHVTNEFVITGLVVKYQLGMLISHPFW